MSLVAAFIVVFVVGPSLFVWILRQAERSAAKSAVALRLGGAAFLLIGAAAVTSFMMQPLLTLCALWLAWVVLLVFCVFRLRSVLTGVRSKFWSFCLGAMGTTIPWFGLATARMMAGI